MSLTALPGLPAWIPRGSDLPDSVWLVRHRWVMAILLGQAVALAPFALFRDNSLAVALLSTGVPLTMGLLASNRRFPRVARASLAAVGLMVESSIAVYLSGGVIEAHFHYFVMVPIVALYEHWVPFGLAVGYVLFQHGIVGTVASGAVYNHHSAVTHPWWWAGVHAGLFAAACLGALVNWTLHERSREVRDQLTEATEHDVLTGLPNRVGLHRLGEETLRHGEPLGVLLIDLDGFKDVNDTLGHAGGDMLLNQVGSRVGSVLRDCDAVGRLGGDEFVVLLPGLDADDARAVAERVRLALAEGFTVQGMDLHVGGSVGVSARPRLSQPHGSDPDLSELLREADVAMYVAKTSGYGAAAYEPGQDLEARRRLTFISELREAIDHDQLVVHFQPKVVLSSGAPRGFEALVRWQHPERGLLTPEDFIGTAMRSSLIDALTGVVLDQALGAVRTWHDAGHLLGVSVNITPQSLGSRDLLDTVDRLLGRYQLAGKWLCLELIEDAVLDKDDIALGLLRELKQRGVTIAIDDFGSGYTSMSYLHRLPADELKIDRALVAELSGGYPTGATLLADFGPVIVRSTIEMGHSLGLRVVAEGVETAQTLDTLRDAGCDEAQGNFIARPMPGEDVVAWLTERISAPTRSVPLAVHQATV